jgi:hypothetical protein
VNAIVDPSIQIWCTTLISKSSRNYASKLHFITLFYNFGEFGLSSRPLTPKIPQNSKWVAGT